MKTPKQELTEVRDSLLKATNKLNEIVEQLLEDEFSKVPIDIKMKLREIEKEIRGCL